MSLSSGFGGSTWGSGLMMSGSDSSAFQGPYYTAKLTEAGHPGRNKNNLCFRLNAFKWRRRRTAQLPKAWKTATRTPRRPPRNLNKCHSCTAHEYSYHQPINCHRQKVLCMGGGGHVVLVVANPKIMQNFYVSADSSSQILLFLCKMGDEFSPYILLVGYTLFLLPPL